ncbi:PKD domain-containing protein [[Eubacterium] cellulosolvens]
MRSRGVCSTCVIAIFIIGSMLASNILYLSTANFESYTAAENHVNADNYLNLETPTDKNCQKNEIDQPNTQSINTRGTPRSPRSWLSDKLMNAIDTNNITFNQLQPIIESDNNRTLYCAWQDIRTGDWDIFFSKSTNFGFDWSTNQLVTNATSSAGHQQYPAIEFGAASERIIYIVWQDMRNDDGDVFFSYSIDDGKIWANEVQVNKKSSAMTPPRQWNPDIASDTAGGIYVVWADDSNGHWDILLSTSTNKGVTWSNPRLVNDPEANVRKFNQSKPTIGVDDDGIIYVAWEDERSGEPQIYLSRSLDSGKTFSKDIRVSSEKPNVKAKNPNLKVFGKGNVFLAWEEDLFSKYNVYFSKSLDYGSSFGKPVQINNFSDKCAPDASPDVDVDARGNIFISWSDQRAKNHIYMAYSTDNGKTFDVNEVVDDADDSPATPISITTQEELERGQQVLTVLQDKIYVAWVDYRDDPNPDNAVPENSNIYLDWNQTIPNRKPWKINFDEKNTTKGWGFINLTWPAAADIDFSRYYIYKSTVQDFTPELLYLNATIARRNQNYVNLTNLSANTNYYFYLKVEDLGGLTNTSDLFSISTNPNIPPVIDLKEPDGIRDLVDNVYEIVWSDSDPDDNASIILYYDTNQIPTDGRTLIAVVPYGEESPIDFYMWDTTKVPNGSYYICAIISDSVNGDQAPRYSSGKVTIFHGNLDPLIIQFRKPLNITGVSINEVVTVRFNKELDMTTVNPSSFYVLNPQGSKVDGDYSYNSSSNILEFTPEVRWNGMVRYDVHLAASISDSSGFFQLGNAYSWWFETEEYIVPKTTIYGEVVEAYSIDTKNPITGVLVTLTDRENTSNMQSATTDSSGRFVFSVEYGVYDLVAAKDYYQDPGKREIIANRTNLDVMVELVRPVIIEFNIQGKLTVDEELKVSAVAVHPRGEEINYFWDFGDGTIKPNQNTTHKYKKSGTYSVKLTVQDNNGGSVSQTETVVVEKAEAETNYLLMVTIFAISILILGLIIILLYARRVRQRRISDMEERMMEESGGRVKLHEEEEEGEEEKELEEEAMVEDEEEIETEAEGEVEVEVEEEEEAPVVGEEEPEHEEPAVEEELLEEEPVEEEPAIDESLVKEETISAEEPAEEEPLPEPETKLSEEGPKGGARAAKKMKPKRKVKPKKKLSGKRPKPKTELEKLKGKPPNRESGVAKIKGRKKLKRPK